MSADAQEASELPAEFQQQCANMCARLRAGKDIDVGFVADQFGMTPEAACKAFAIALAIIRALALAEQLPRSRLLN